ncbi:MAG: PEP-CTERM sorting domain-containing protein [Kiritimatiellales bacterium]|nr:PEP-CTERM sorting domain-containing protein [Kiritimatiellales bacterium]
MKYTVLCLSFFAVACAEAVVIESYGSFDVYYHDVGEVWNGMTNAQAWSATQQEDIRSAIDEWDRVILNTSARQIRMHVLWDSFSGNTLGGSSSYLLAGTDGGGQSTIWTGSELVWREAYDAGNAWDTYIRYDVDAAGLAWNFGAAAPTGNEIDFRSVITHEIGHSLGWLGSYDPSLDDFGYGGYGLTTYESFLVDSNGNKPLNGGTGTPGNFNELDNPFYFDGFNATNLYGGLVPIYAPSTYEPGSSLSHLDTGTFPDYTMSHAISIGDTRRSLSDLEIAMMADMGWDVIPEPSTIVILILGSAGFYGIRRFFPA